MDSGCLFLIREKESARMCKGMDGDVRKWEGSNVRRCECAQVGRGDLSRGVSQKANLRC